MKSDVKNLKGKLIKPPIHNFQKLNSSRGWNTSNNLWTSITLPFLSTNLQGLYNIFELVYTNKANKKEIVKFAINSWNSIFF